VLIIEKKTALDKRCTITISTLATKEKKLLLKIYGYWWQFTALNSKSCQASPCDT